MTIQDVVCHVPPPGFVFDYLSGEMVETGIYRSSSDPVFQKWEIPPAPDEYDEKRLEEEEKQELDPDYTDPELEAYRSKEWFRRINGFWFMNNGKPVYITGNHYYYLAHWKIDIGPPSFWYSDLQFFYFWASCVEDPRCGGVLAFDRRRAGKCFALGTKIRMYDGSLKNVEDVECGDKLMGPDSLPRIAHGLTNGEAEMYEVVPNRNESFVVNGDHILSMVYNNGCANRKRGWSANSVVNVTVDEYLALTKSEKSHLVLYSSGWGENYKESQHLITPYILGLWLGDGTSTQSSITTNDPEIVAAMQEFADSIGMFVQKEKSKYVYTFVNRIGHGMNHKKCSALTNDGEVVDFESVRDLNDFFGSRATVAGLVKRGEVVLDVDNTGYLNKFRGELSRLGLIKNKRIPNEYLIDSVNNRLQLLAGIVDTDGHLGKGRYYEVTQKNELLTEDIACLAKSLGFYVSVTPKMATMRRNDGTTYSCRVYRINICGDIHKIPCRIERKKAARKNARNIVTRTGIKEVRSLGVGKYFGFAVDSDHLFLLGSGLVVHNSWKSSSIITEALTRTKRALGGIQSKNGADARDFFQLFVVEGFRQLPHFFKPEYDRTQGDTPKAELRFFATSEKGKQARGKKKVEALNSRINFKDASERAYDGKKIIRGVLDEFGKLEDADLEERHRVLKFCIQDGPKIVGKLLYITTVEDIKNSDCLRKAQKMFKESDPLKRNANGQTETLLYRFRLPFYESYMMDDYGMPLREEAKQRVQAILDELTAKGDYVSVASERRKNPWNDDDIFRSSSSAPIFDVIKISEQLSYLSWKEPKELYRRGNFAWEGGVKNSRVKFVDMPNGRFLLRTNEMENARQSLQRPINKHRFASGVDPFEHKASFEPSNGAAHVLKKYDPMSPEMQNEFVLEYCARPQPNVFFQDMVKMCIYFGVPILCEANRIGLINYFIDNGYEEFLTWLPGQKNPGIFAGEKSKQHGAEKMDNYVTDMCHTIMFPALLNDLSRFDLSDSTKYDRAMSAIWTLVAAGDTSAEEAERPSDNINDFFKTHKIK